MAWALAFWQSVPNLMIMLPFSPNLRRMRHSADHLVRSAQSRRLPMRRASAVHSKHFLLLHQFEEYSFKFIVLGICFLHGDSLTSMERKHSEVYLLICHE